MFDGDHLVNPELLRMTRRLGGFGKLAFVPGGDPAMAGGGGGDPAAAGGDPAAAGGGDPPPPGGGGDPMASLQPMIQQAVQQAMMAQGGAGGGAGGPLKPKIDVNVEMMQIKNMLAKICDQLGVQIPAQDMVATPDKLTAMAQGQSTATPGQGGGGAIGGMPGMDPMQGAGVPGAGPEKVGTYRGNGTSFDTGGFGDVANKASAIAKIRRARGGV